MKVGALWWNPEILNRFDKSRRKICWHVLFFFDKGQRRCFLQKAFTYLSTFVDFFLSKLPGLDTVTTSLVLHSADTCSCHFDRLGQGCGALGRLLLACEVTDRLQQQSVACFPPRKHNKWNHSGLKDISLCMCVHAVWHFVTLFYT